jgi:CheY-like chemotaxis protein
VRSTTCRIVAVHLGHADVEQDRVGAELRRRRDRLDPVMGGAETDRNRSQEAGFDHHLVKPVDPVGLARLLARVASDPDDAG